MGLVIGIRRTYDPQTLVVNLLALEKRIVLPGCQAHLGLGLGLIALLPCEIGHMQPAKECAGFLVPRLLYGDVVHSGPRFQCQLGGLLFHPRYAPAVRTGYSLLPRPPPPLLPLCPCFHSNPAACLISGSLISWLAAVDPLLSSLCAKLIQPAREAYDLPGFRERVELQERAVRVAKADLHGPVSTVP